MPRKRTLWLLCVLAATAVSGLWLLRRPSLENRVYRIGWQEDPPNMFTGPTGEPEGFGPDVVNEAARRRGIQLQWVYVPRSSAESLREGKVDLWPLLTVLPERRQFVHYSDPYFRNYLSLVVRSGSPYQSPKDLRGKRIGYYDLPVNRQRIMTMFAGTIPVAQASTRQGIRDLMDGSVDALVVDELKLVAELMQGAIANGPGLRVLPSSLPTAELALAGTFAAAPAVEALREEIEAMSTDGSASKLILARGITTRREISDMTAMVHAAQQVRRMAFALGAAALLALLGAGLALGYRRQRNSARTFDRARRKAETQLRLVADSLSEMVLAYDMDRRLIYANPALQTLTGYSSAEVLQAGFVDWIHPDDKQRMTSHWDALFEGQEFTAESYRLVRKDGTCRWMLASWGPMRDESGKQVGVRGSERDVTELTEAQAEMRRLAAAVAQTTDAVVITDLQGTIQYVNPAFERITGYTQQDALGQNPRLLRSGRHGPDFYRELWSTIRSGRSWTGQIVNRRKDGSLYTEHCTISPVLNEKGEVERFVAVKKDITQELALEEQVRQSQKMESIGKLAGGVAHDFNNLLTVISGNAQLALKALTASDPAAARLTRILDATDRASGLTRQLLTFSRKQAVQPEVLDINSVVLQMEAMLASLMGDSAHLRFELHPGIAPIYMDPSHLHQVLMNLAVNARDAMDGAGAITIRTMPLGERALLEVEDTGQGIDPAIMDRIFEPFYSTKPPGRGTGLGLAVVYGIVTQSGGEISVESQPGRGSRFKVYLPAAKGVPARPEARETTDAVHTSASVLLVEDQPEVRAFIAEVLRSAGYRVTEAQDGPSGLAAARALPELDFLLTDLSMPGMNGAELARAVLLIHPTSSVLCMSGFAADQPTLPWPLLQKPFPPEALLSTLLKHRPGPAQLQ